MKNLSFLLMLLLFPLVLQADPPRGLRPSPDKAKTDAEKKNYKVETHWWEGWEKRTNLVTGKSQYRLIPGSWVDTKEDFYRAWDARAAANRRAFASLNDYNQQIAQNIQMQQSQTQQAYSKPLSQPPQLSTQRPQTTVKPSQPTYVLPSGREVNQHTYRIVDGPNGTVAVPREPVKSTNLLQTK